MQEIEGHAAAAAELAAQESEATKAPLMSAFSQDRSTEEPIELKMQLGYAQASLAA